MSLNVSRLRCDIAPYMPKLQLYTLPLVTAETNLKYQISNFQTEKVHNKAVRKFQILFAKQLSPNSKFLQILNALTYISF